MQEKSFLLIVQYRPLCATFQWRPISQQSHKRLKCSSNLVQVQTYDFSRASFRRTFVVGYFVQGT